MKHKERYYTALIENNGLQNEIDLGRNIYLDESETRKIIAQLLSEHKIEYVVNRACNYSVVKKKK